MTVIFLPLTCTSTRAPVLALLFDG